MTEADRPTHPLRAGEIYNDVSSLGCVGRIPLPRLNFSSLSPLAFLSIFPCTTLSWHSRSYVMSLNMKTQTKSISFRTKILEISSISRLLGNLYPVFLVINCCFRQNCTSLSPRHFCCLHPNRLSFTVDLGIKFPIIMFTFIIFCPSSYYFS